MPFVILYCCLLRISFVVCAKDMLHVRTLKITQNLNVWFFQYVRVSIQLNSAASFCPAKPTSEIYSAEITIAMFFFSNLKFKASCVLKKIKLLEAKNLK